MQSLKEPLRAEVEQFKLCEDTVLLGKGFAYSQCSSGVAFDTV